MARVTPLSFMANAIKNFHIFFWKTSLTLELIFPFLILIETYPTQSVRTAFTILSEQVDENFAEAKAV